MILMSLKTTEFSCHPWATVPVDGDAADLLDAVLTALEQDPRALGPTVGYDYDTSRVGAIFQVDVPAFDERLRSSGALTGAAAAINDATDVFAIALEHAGVDASARGVEIVEGDDPDLLP